MHREQKSPHAGAGRQPPDREVQRAALKSGSRGGPSKGLLGPQGPRLPSTAPASRRTLAGISPVRRRRVPRNSSEGSDMPRDNDQPTDADLASFIRTMNARFEGMPSPPAEPELGKPPKLISAEADLFRCEITMRLLTLNCGDVGKCRDRRCQRAKRCRKRDEIQPLFDEVTARVAIERSKWKPAASQASKKGAPRRALRKSR
jgi:hypothetical protein